MYYCPCPCSDPSDPDLVEENTFISLPRNLSYVQESYLDAHDVSGRFVYNSQTERRIAIAATTATNNENGGVPVADTSAGTYSNTNCSPTSPNGVPHNSFLHRHPHYHHNGSVSNGVGGGGGGGGEGSGSIATTTTTTTTIIKTTATTTSNRWRADGTKVEVGLFENGSTPTTAFTGKRSLSSDFESRQEVLRKEVNNTRNEGEGETEGLERTVGNENDEEKYLLSVVKSRRDPTIHFGCVTVPNLEASDFTTNSTVLDQTQTQSQRGNESLCGVVGLNNNSCNSECSSISNKDSGPISPASTPTASLPSSSSFFPSKCNVQSSSSSSSSSSSKPSFISRVTSLLSPKDETSPVNPTHPVLDLGSSVDGEPTFYDSDHYPDKSDPSQPLLLRSPDRSGLIMDRGEDIITPSSNDHDEHSSLMTCTTDAAAVSSANDISQPCGVDAFLDEGQSMHHVGKRDVDSVEEDVLVIQYGDGSPPASDSTGQLGDDEQSKLLLLLSTTDLNTTQNSVSPPEYYNEDLETNGVVMSESDKLLLIQTKAQTTTVVSCESPPDNDSDAFSEEGVFVNMMDDGDTLMETCATASEVSEDTCFSVDSMFCSPDEIEPAMGTNDGDKCGVDDCGKESPRRMSLEEAISKAASDFNKMTMLMYPDVKAAFESQNEDSKAEQSVPSTSKTWSKSERLQMLSRGSPVYGIPALSIHITSSSNSMSSDVDASHEERHSYSKESPIYEDNEFNFNKRTLRKSSSLKTNKTPPGTPHRKKAVRFADAMGLDLESVRHVLNTESPPKIPASAMADLRQGLSEDRVNVGSRFLTACFTQPGANNDFVTTVLSQKVRLENAIITDLTITGFIRVSNIAFHKSVRVRYTHNRWSTFHDIAANYIQGSCDGPTDRFSFSIVAPAHFIPGNRLEFAVSYNAEGTEYWDSNGGNNYVFECFAKTVPTENDREWLHFL